MTIEFDPARHCGAETNPLNGATPCRWRKGQGTTHVGSGHCKLHGGSSPTGRRHAVPEAAANALAELGIAPAAAPVEVLFEQVRVAAWRELGLRQMVLTRPALFGPDHLDDEREDVVSAMHDRSVKRAAEIAKLAIDAGLDERMVRLVEGQGEVIHRILTVALDAAGVTAEARAQAEQAVIRELFAVGPSGAEIS